MTLIKREDAVKTVIRKCSPICAWQVGTQQYPDCVVAEINALPSTEAEPKWTCTANFIAEQLERLKDMTDEERWDFLIRFFSPSADRPSGEWTYLHGSIGSYMTISCPFCGTTFNDVAEWEYNYCPNCGAYMRGEEA